MIALPTDVRALFAGQNYAHVATLMPDGAPHTVPLWVGIEDDRVAFLTAPSSRKARNLELDPRLSLSITDANQPTTMAQIRGRVWKRLEGEAAWAVIDRLSMKYIGQPYPRDDDRVVFLVDAERAWAHKFA